jgi:preprotein translocase subunit SecD
MRKILIGVGIAAAVLLLVASWAYVLRDYLPLGPGGHVLLDVAVPASSDSGLHDRVMAMTQDVLQHRVPHASFRRVGQNRLMVELYGSPDLAALGPVLTRRGLLSLHLVDNSLSAYDGGGRNAPIGDTAYVADGQVTMVSNASLLRGGHVVSAEAGFDSATNEPCVNVRWDDAGTARWANITTRYLNRRIALVMDDRLLTAPVVNTPILGGSVQITGSFTLGSANELAALLRGGTLPAPVRIIASSPGRPD